MITRRFTEQQSALFCSWPTLLRYDPDRKDVFHRSLLPAYAKDQPRRWPCSSSRFQLFSHQVRCCTRRYLSHHNDPHHPLNVFAVENITNFNCRRRWRTVSTADKKFYPPVEHQTAMPQLALFCMLRHNGRQSLSSSCRLRRRRWRRRWRDYNWLRRRRRCHHFFTASTPDNKQHGWNKKRFQ